MKKQRLSTICNCVECREVNRSYRRTQVYMIVGIAISSIVYLFTWYRQA